MYWLGHRVAGWRGCDLASGAGGWHGAPGTHTVGAVDCEYITIQAAVDDDAVAPGDILSIVDAVHTEGGIVLRKDVIIQGRGADRTVVQAHATAEEARQRVFFVEKGATVVIRDLTIRHGNPVMDEYFRSGGGVLNRGTVTIENCVISHNIANNGGGIWNNRGAVTVVNSTISENLREALSYSTTSPGPREAAASMSGPPCISRTPSSPTTARPEIASSAARATTGEKARSAPTSTT